MIVHAAACGTFRLIPAGGQGAPLVLVHGWGGQASQWDALVPTLAGHFQVWLAEMPGGPGLPLTGPVSMAALGGGLARCLKLADLPPAFLLGHSMGGPVIVEAALAAPDLVAGLLGLDTLADRAFYGGCDAVEIATRRAEFSQDLPGRTARMIDAIAAPQTGPDLRRQITDGILKADPADLLALRDAMFSWRVGDRVPLLAVPLRLLNSAAVEAAHRRDPLPCLNRVRQRVYGDGHFPQLEIPDRLAPLVLAELAELCPRS